MNLTDVEMDLVNKLGWSKAANVNSRVAIYFDNLGINPKVDKTTFKEYKHVANAYTSDLEEAFDFGNISESETEYKRLIPSPSISTGDVLYSTKTNTYHLVKSIGFEEIKL